jgi:hypothetical protein
MRPDNNITDLPLLRHAGPDAAFAWRDGRVITVADFLGEVSQLAESLPARRHVINLCTDRYRFVAGFAAALVRGQIVCCRPITRPSC